MWEDTHGKHYIDYKEEELQSKAEDKQEEKVEQENMEVIKISLNPTLEEEPAQHSPNNNAF